MSETKDKRVEDRRQRFIIEVTDHVNLPLYPDDLERIGEQMQDVLRGNFDMTVEDVQIETFSDYKERVRARDAIGCNNARGLGRGEVSPGDFCSEWTPRKAAPPEPTR